MQINETITSACSSSRGAHIPQLIVCHIAEGTYEGTKSWFLNPASETSSHFIVGQDGRICQSLSLERMAWCNGTNADRTSTKYFGHSTVDMVQELGGNANQYSVSIECEGFHALTGGALTEAQFKAVAWLIPHIQQEVQRLYKHKILLDRRYLVGHNEITPKTRPNCPGDKFPWNNLMAVLGNGIIAPSLLYRIQVGAFSVYDNAVGYLNNTVLPAGVEAFIKKCEDGLYRIQVGAFSVRANAETYLEEVYRRGLDAFLVLEEAGA